MSKDSAEHGLEKPIFGERGWQGTPKTDEGELSKDGAEGGEARPAEPPEHKPEEAEGCPSARHAQIVAQTFCTYLEINWTDFLLFTLFISCDPDLEFPSFWYSSFISKPASDNSL